MKEVDHRIISRLVENGRTPLTELAKEVGYTPMGVKKRLEKLLRRDLIKVSASVNVREIGLIPVLVLLEVVSGDAARAILKRFEECPRMVYFFTALGGFNLVALMVAEDYKTLESISSENCSIRKMSGVRRAEYYPIGEVYYEPFLPVRLNLVNRRFEKAPCGVECPLCTRYREEKCVGCPATKYYRGQL